jgi:hypothetical protein
VLSQSLNPQSKPHLFDFTTQWSTSIAVDVSYEFLTPVKVIVGSNQAFATDLIFPFSDFQIPQTRLPDNQMHYAVQSTSQRLRKALQGRRVESPSLDLTR